MTSDNNSDHESYAYSSEEDEYDPLMDSDEEGGGGGGGGDNNTNTNTSMEWDMTGSTTTTTTTTATGMLLPPSRDNPNAAPTMNSKGTPSNINMSSSSSSNPLLGGNSGMNSTMFKSGIRMMKSDELRPEMIRRLHEITEVLGISESAAGVLLREHNWCKEDLLEDYMNDPDKVLQHAGVFYRCNSTTNPSTTTPPLSTCPICYDDVDTYLTMPCGHAFCYDCWYDFCVNAIAEGPICVRKTCPQAGCTEVVTEEEMESALQGGESKATIKSSSSSSSPDLQKYLSFQLRSFVESNALTRWCPGRGCERVACAISASAMEAEGHMAYCDSCAITFCIRCGEEPHAPCICKELAKWNEKCRNESETANWILANTKSCPKCVSRIEKNNGCNHMTCQRCSHEFCWICMGEWGDHGANTGGYYKCNKYEGSNTVGYGEHGGANNDAAAAKRDLDRYLHYYKRFHAHAEGQKFATKQLKETEQRMVLLQESSDDAKWSDVEFLKAANEQLVECRRVLKYTYVFAFYMDPRNAMQRERFEYHQEMLERFTETLSELSEKPLNEMDRTDVVNQTRVVDRFMKNILKYVEEGMEEG